METLAARAIRVVRRWWPEVLLAVLAGVVFLGCLGSVELWGKREQRASAEAIDTIDHQHWLVAQIQGRPRLEKPPLPRWSIAALMVLTGRRDEWIVRLPGAFSAMATVALIYFLGRRMGGRSVGLASALVLCSLAFYVGEMRQASNDGPLALFTTLALCAAWRRLHDSDDEPADSRSSWNLVLYTALGLGILTKGPVILLLTSVTIIPYLAISRKLIWGLGRLADVRGLGLFAALGLSWPAAVLWQDPSALGVWSVEMSEKTGLSRIIPHLPHTMLLEQWPGLVLPWSLIALVAAALPFLPKRLNLSLSVDRAAGLIEPSAGRESWASPVWFPWWWAVGNLGMFCFWAVAKPNYYVPCLPGMALLIGLTWVRLARVARIRDSAGGVARLILQAQWVAIFVAAVVAPLVLRPWLPTALWPWSVAIATALVVSVVVSVHAWRRGADALTLAPLSAACVAGIVVVYGFIAPSENAQRSHRALAQSLPSLIPDGVRTLMFFNEIDEGLWFYLSLSGLGRELDLAPVPGCHPRYNLAYDLVESHRARPVPAETIADVEAKRQVHDKAALIAWLDRADPSASASASPYLLIRNSLYERLAGDLAGRVRPLYRETGMKRNELILLQVVGSPSAIATTPSPTRR
jgi:4-amino-4-deoxy-L-arabinose transferase-like glycosyltransferase